MLVLYTGTFVILLVLYYYVSHRSSDPYGTFHLSFNKVPGSLNPPRTEWLNMGFWKDTTVFPEACQALALRLFQAASLKPNGRVLDVGHGSGDSILLQLSHPEVPTPALLCGITSLSSHHRRSRERVNNFLSSAEATERTPDVLLFEGDAIWRPGHRDNEHPLSPHSGHEFDNILALDCAHHFDPRREFLHQSFQRLAPGGRVALADLCFSDPPSASLKFLLSGMLRIMPRSNLLTKEQYVQQMNEIGYEDIRVEDITPFVFPGFRNFLKQQGIIWGAFAGTMGWLQGRGLRFVVIGGRKRESGLLVDL